MTGQRQHVNSQFCALSDAVFHFFHSNHDYQIIKWKPKWKERIKPQDAKPLEWNYAFFYNRKIENTDYNFLNIVFLCYNLVPMNAKPVSGETETLLYGRKKYELWELGFKFGFENDE